MSAHGSLPRVRPPAADSNLRACASHHRLSLPWPTPPPRRLGRPHRVRQLEPTAVVSAAAAAFASIAIESTALAVLSSSPSSASRSSWSSSSLVAPPLPSSERRQRGGDGPARIRARVGWRGGAWVSHAHALLHGPQSHGRCRMGRCRMGRCRVRRSRAICRAPPDAHARMKSAEYPPHAPLGSAHWDLGSRVARPVYTCIIHPGIHLPGVYQRCILWYTR